MANSNIKTTGDIFAAVREYKLAKGALEALKKQDKQAFIISFIEQDTQENGDKQNIFYNNIFINIDENKKYIVNIGVPGGADLEQLDQDSPQFNIDLYQEKITAVIEELQALVEEMRDAFISLWGEFVETEQEEEEKQELQKLTNGIKDTMQDLYTNKERYKNAIQSFILMAENIDKLQETLEAWQELEPYLEAELQKPEYNGLTINELVENNLLEKAIAAAKAAQLPHITVTGKGTNNVEYPVDKLNANIWTLLIDADKNGQFAFAAEKRGSKKQADIIYSINFDELENAGLNTVKRLTAFDKRVYIATSALFNGASEYMTVSQIYATMGNDSRPNTRDIKKIYTSLEKMRRLTISLDNFTSENSEAKTYPNIPKFVYNGALLPWESIDAIVNGQRADGIIHLFREPPLVSFAKERKQITTVSRKLLASPISKTDAHLLIDDYLIERISHIKNNKGKFSNKLLYSTVFEKTGAKSRCQKSRGKETITKYLDHYKQCGFIKDYKEAVDGVTIIY